jgi:hypothetical protein
VVLHVLLQDGELGLEPLVRRLDPLELLDEPVDDGVLLVRLRDHLARVLVLQLLARRIEDLLLELRVHLELLADLVGDALA